MSRPGAAEIGQGTVAAIYIGGFQALGVERERCNPGKWRCQLCDQPKQRVWYAFSIESIQSGLN